MVYGSGCCWRQVTAEAERLDVAGMGGCSGSRVMCGDSTLLLCHVWIVLCFRDYTRVGIVRGWVAVGWDGVILYTFFGSVIKM